MKLSKGDVIALGELNQQVPPVVSSEELPQLVFTHRGSKKRIKKPVPPLPHSRVSEQISRVVSLAQTLTNPAGELEITCQEMIVTLQEILRTIKE